MRTGTIGDCWKRAPEKVRNLCQAGQMGCTQSKAPNSSQFEMFAEERESYVTRELLRIRLGNAGPWDAQRWMWSSQLDVLFICETAHTTTSAHLV